MVVGMSPKKFQRKTTWFRFQRMFENEINASVRSIGQNPDEAETCNHRFGFSENVSPTTTGVLFGTVFLV